MNKTSTELRKETLEAASFEIYGIHESTFRVRDENTASNDQVPAVKPEFETSLNYSSKFLYSLALAMSALPDE